MRLANLNNRAVLLEDGRALDIEKASGGRFSADPMDVWADWSAFTAWAADAEFDGAEAFDAADLQAPVPRPRQIFAIGLNYRDHADESGFAYPDAPVVFTKFQSSLAGPEAKVRVPADQLDYEAELVAVVGREVSNATEAEAVDAIAGYAVGQDFSERGVQLRPPSPQFSLGKSFAAFGPFGPAVVTPDEVGDAGSLSITCKIEGPTAESKGVEQWVAQDGNTRDLIFSVPRLISDLSQVVTLYPGDIIFTGTPAGVGRPQGVALQPGDVVTTTIENVGTLRNELV